MVQRIVINAIIIAAIALLVLVILTVNLTKLRDKFPTGTEHCINTLKGGCGGLNIDGSPMPCESEK